VDSVGVVAHRRRWAVPQWPRVDGFLALVGSPKAVGCIVVGRPSPGVLLSLHQRKRLGGRGDDGTHTSSGPIVPCLQLPSERFCGLIPAVPRALPLPKHDGVLKPSVSVVKGLLPTQQGRASSFSLCPTPHKIFSIPPPVHAFGVHCLRRSTGHGADAMGKS